MFSASTGEFLGTALLVRESAFKGQPCPTDPPGQYTFLPDAGIPLPFYACHRYDTDF